MSDKDYLFLIPFLVLLLVLAAGFFLKLPILIGLAIPFLIIVIAAKLF